MHCVPANDCTTAPSTPVNAVSTVLLSFPTEGKGDWRIEDKSTCTGNSLCMRWLIAYNAEQSRPSRNLLYASSHRLRASAVSVVRLDKHTGKFQARHKIHKHTRRCPQAILMHKHPVFQGADSPTLHQPGSDQDSLCSHSHHGPSATALVKPLFLHRQPPLQPKAKPRIYSS